MVVSPHVPRQLTATHAFMQSAATKLLIICLNAATGILSARALAPSGRGELSAMILWYVFLASALTFGVPSALTYRLRQYPESASELTGAAALLALGTCVVAGIVGFFGLPYWLPQYSHEVLFFARIFLLNSPVAAFVLIGRAAMESKGDLAASNLSLIGPPALTVTGMLLLLQLHDFNPVNAAWCYVLAGMPSVVLLARSFQRAFRPNLHRFSLSCSRLLSYGIRSYGIDLCGTMAVYVDQALVVRILRPGMMGTYVVALSLSRMLNAFHTTVVMILFPRAATRSPREVLAMTGQAVRLTTLLTTLCGACVIVLGPRLLTFLYGAEYQDAAAILRILVIEVILAGAAQVLSQAFMALERPGVITTLQVVGLLLCIPLMLLLVPRFGIAGAALSLLLSTCARLVFVLGSFRRYLDLPHPGLLPQRSDCRFIADAILRPLRALKPNLLRGEA